jgi:hypothetical protein
LGADTVRRCSIHVLTTLHHPPHLALINGVDSPAAPRNEPRQACKCSLLVHERPSIRRVSPQYRFSMGRKVQVVLLLLLRTLPEADYNAVFLSMSARVLGGYHLSIGWKVQVVESWCFCFCFGLSQGLFALRLSESGTVGRSDGVFESDSILLGMD